MNVRLCLILKYILPWQTLYRGGQMFIQKAYFLQTNYFYPNNKLLLSD